MTHTPTPLTEQAEKILNSFRQHRFVNGDPDLRKIKKNIERTDTRHVLPVGWVWR
jgi:hypothetical protein